MDFLDFIRKQAKEKKQRFIVKHYGPGPHKSGSPQSVHGGKGKRGKGQAGAKEGKANREKQRRENEAFEKFLAGKTKKQRAWWRKYGKRPVTEWNTNTKAILEAAEADDKEALAYFDKKALRRVRDDLSLKNKPRLMGILREALGEESQLSILFREQLGIKPRRK